LSDKIVPGLALLEFYMFIFKLSGDCEFYYSRGLFAYLESYVLGI
jgi:hypothetical protein